MSLLLNKTKVPRSQPSTSTLPPQDHRNDQQCHSETDKPTGNEHVLETVSFHPRCDGEWDTNADCVAKESYTCEGVTGNLVSSDQMRSIGRGLIRESQRLTSR